MIIIRCLMIFVIVALAACGGGGGGPDGPRIVWMTKEIDIFEGDEIFFDSLIERVPESPVIRFYKGDELVYEYEYSRISGTGVRIRRTIIPSAKLSDAGDYRVVLYLPDSEEPYIESDIIPVRVAERTQPEDSVVPAPEQVAWISGMYDASVGENSTYDEAYYFISSDGLIEVFDYRNDAIDSDGNCHILSPAGKQNHGLQGRSVFWRESNSSFVFIFKEDAGPVEGAIGMDESNEIYRVCISGVCSGVSVTIGSRVLRKDRVLSPTIENIRSSMCD